MNSLLTATMILLTIVMAIGFVWVLYIFEKDKTASRKTKARMASIKEQKRDGQ